MTTVNLVIPDAVVEAAHLSEPELRLEFALFMYQQDRLTLGQASAFAGISQVRGCVGVAIPGRWGAGFATMLI